MNVSHNDLIVPKQNNDFMNSKLWKLFDGGVSIALSNLPVISAIYSKIVAEIERKNLIYFSGKLKNIGILFIRSFFTEFRKGDQLRINGFFVITISEVRIPHCFGKAFPLFPQCGSRLQKIRNRRI